MLSQWVLDFLVQRPGRPLYDNTGKVGLGLWNAPAPAFLLEVAILFGGIGTRVTLWTNHCFGPPATSRMYGVTLFAIRRSSARLSGSRRNAAQPAFG